METHDQLDLEAGRLHDAWSHDGERWDDLDDAEREPFRAVAREARRLHGVEPLKADVEPLAELRAFEVTFGGIRYFAAASNADQAVAVAVDFSGKADVIAAGKVGYREIDAAELRSTRMILNDLGVVTLGDVLTSVTQPCVLASTKGVR